MSDRASVEKGRVSARETGTVRALVVVSSALVLAALPIFMVGGLAVQIREDLALSETAFGAAVTLGFAVGASAALLGGRLADRLGPRVALFSGATLSALSLVFLGTLVDSWGRLVAALCLSGLAVALTDPGLAILVGRVVAPDRQGLAFGVKEASIPAATLVAGLAVPWIALTVGWQWAFGIGLVPLAALIWLLPRIVEPRGAASHGRPAERIPVGNRRGLLLAGAAGLLGSAAASGVGVFLTESAVAMGLEPGSAGLLLAFGSIAGIAARVGAGVAADRTGGSQFRLISWMLAVGAVTIALGGTGTTALLVVGTVGAFTGGWAWTGIFFLSLVKTNPSRPGAVAGIGSASLGLGNAAGPILFGYVAQSASFGMAWLVAGALAGAGAVLMAVARSRIPG